MGNSQDVGELLRHRLRAERIRRGWSQQAVADKMMRFGMYGSTLAKIEGGTRAVTAKELAAFADIYNTTPDVLLGRRPASATANMLWAASKLTSNAHKMVSEVWSLQQRISGDITDLISYAHEHPQEQSVESLIEAGQHAYDMLQIAQEALSALVNEFPLPGRAK